LNKLEKIKMEKENKKLYLVTFGFLLVLVLALILFFNNPNLTEEEISAQNLEELKEKFLILSDAGTNFCAGPGIVEKVNSERLQGSCCGPMDFHRYAEQIEGLKKYSKYEIIPIDPYDVSKEWADEFIDYYGVPLTDEKQKIYDEASLISHEGGPCCCKCWHWYTYGGLAKYLIIEENFSAEQIAEIWDLSDACGGKGHTHGD
jgi:hypothetical protein